MKELALSIDGQTVQAPGGIPTGGLTSLNTLIQSGIHWMLYAAIMICLFYLIFGGFKWMTAGGEAPKVAAAKKHLTFAITGLVLALFAFTIVSVIGYFLGVNYFQ